MAKLFKHLGLGGGGGKRGSGTSNSPQCDRVRQLFPEQSSPPGHGSPISSSLSIGDTETDSSAASTISSANRSTVGSEDFPNPPPSWLNSSNASMIVSSNSSSTFVADLNGSGNKEQANMKMANIYENQEVFAQSEKSKLFNEDCWNEVKIWLQEMSNPASLSSTHQPTQSDIDNARFLAEILSALQKVRSEIFPSESEGRPIALIQAPGHSDRNGKTGMRVGNMLSEVVMKLESEYERARKSLTSKDYERYTRLKELLRFEIQEPIYGLQEFIARPLDDCLVSADALLPPMVESCFYDEPWNSDDVHVELEDQFQVSRAMATSSGSNNGVVTSSESSTAEFLQATQSSLTSSPHEVDARTRTGYEPPWDWKPHQKDGRREEGYEKPWDLKPHHKDSRPSKEYEEPWDHKGPRVESDLMAAKMAKEARESGLADAEDSQQLQKKYKDHKLPAKDYEDPWDQKTKEIECDLIAAKIAKVTARIGMPTIISTKAAEDGGPKAVPGVSDPTSGENQMKKKKSPAVPVTLAQQHCTQPIQHQTSQQHQQFFSPFKKPLPPLPSSASQSPLLSQADSPRMRLSEAGGSSNVQLTLSDQIWYHGAIGRSEAENLLHKQREASYLVRKSENSPNDYSLSVRSNRGFMHLKIVTDSNGRYILGQFSQPFISIPQMVQYYTSSKLPIKGAEHTSLHHPVPRGSP